MTKSYPKTLLFFTLIGLIGGFFTGIYLIDSYPADMQQLLIEELSALGLVQIPVNILLGIITAVQSAAYGLVLGGIGLIIAKRCGLWEDEIELEAKPTVLAAIVSIVGGLLMILPDTLYFAQHSDAIRYSYLTKPTVAYMLASVTYAAVIEEVIIRLFLMSLIALILHKIFDRGEDEPSVTVLALANVISALLFAAGHLPVTLSMIGDSPLIIFRCFALNGVLGIAFGWLYRKYGLRYAMIAHGGCHIVSKLIWILFI